MNFSEIYRYYKREDIVEELLRVGKNREVVGVFKNGSFDTRPNTIMNPKDIEVMIKSGVIEFHCSLERWSNVMALKSDNYEQLRTGWDIVFDIDCKQFEHAKLTAGVVASTLKKHEIKNFSIKFSGGKGFHIAIPWESLPKDVDYKPTVELFPELARKICIYLKEYMRNELEKAFLRKWSPEELAEQTGKKLGEIIPEYDLDPFQVVDIKPIDPFQIIEIDPVLISQRHLFRMPYSLNSKTFLVSLPINPNKLEEFEREHASPDKVKVEEKFLVKGEENEAEYLVINALDWYRRREREERKNLTKRKVVLKRAVKEEMFPPCIKLILNGLSDGRKRSVFILINFLSNVGWSKENIETLIWEWNKKNTPPLGDSYIRGQLRHFQRRGSTPLPPNCLNEAYMRNFGVCKPDEICRDIKNPVSYPFRLLKRYRK
jgi:DNA primase catalytic subunit